MKWRVLLSLLAFLATAPPQGDVTAKGGTISGTVRRLDTGDPLVGVGISLEGSLSLTGRDAVTDTAGYFVLRNVPPGAYTIRASRTGYSAPVENGKLLPEGGAEKRGTIRAGEHVEHADLTLILSRVLSGRLQDPDGQPVRGITVRAVRLPDGRGAPAGANAVQTNEDGEYRIWGLDPGRYYVTARYIVEGGLPTPPGPSRESWRETYYPGALAPDKAAVFDVTEKPEIDGIDFRILAVKGFRVSGKVTHPSIDLSEERPTIVLIPRGATIADERRNRPEYNQTWGGFDLREVLPGNYTLLATLFRWLPDANSTREVVAAGAIDVSVASDVTELNVPLSSSGVNVTGRVSSGARRLEVGLHALGDDTLSLPFLMEAAGQLTTQTLNGTFHFTNVPPGAYSVTINQTVVETRIDVGEKSPPPLQIVIKSD